MRLVPVGAGVRVQVESVQDVKKKVGALLSPTLRSRSTRARKVVDGLKLEVDLPAEAAAATSNRWSPTQ